MKRPFLRDFEIKTDHLIWARRPDLMIISKKKKKKKEENLPNSGHSCSGWPLGKTEKSEKKNKCQDLARELKKTMKHESSSDTICNWCTRYSHQRIDEGTERLGSKRTSGDHPNYSSIKISQILRRVLETWGNLLLHKLEGETISECWCEKLSNE